MSAKEGVEIFEHIHKKPLSIKRAAWNNVAAIEKMSDKKGSFILQSKKMNSPLSGVEGSGVEGWKVKKSL
ncbi:hypothetical protein IIC38_15300 [candidate division KSB1 bacterium]|nr:hypothetical protein [candidate division KSB1 bacterium]